VNRLGLVISGGIGAIQVKLTPFMVGWIVPRTRESQIGGLWPLRPRYLTGIHELFQATPRPEVAPHPVPVCHFIPANAEVPGRSVMFLPLPG
jgi:hypothetical protein